MGKKNILFVLQALPWPLEFGGKQAMFNGIAALKDVANIYITYKIFNKDQSTKEREMMINNLGGNVIVYPFVEKRDMGSFRKIMHKIVDGIDKRLFKNNQDFLLETQLKINEISEDEIVFINRIIEKHHIDIVQVEMLTHLTLVNSLPNTVRKVFVHHELGFVSKRQILKETNANAYYHSMAESYNQMEIGLLNKYDDVIVLSNIDKRKLIEAGVVKPIHTSFAIVKQPPLFNPVIEDYHNLFFIGPSKHKPNLYAVKWFLENCWQNLLQKDGSFRLKIIGKWDRDSVRDFSTKYEKIDFLGYVNDLSDYLKNGIMIVPITIGSGIRMKILEAAANGLPVVSTTVGAEGLPIESGENGFLADNPEDFVNDILMLSDKKLRYKFVHALDNVIRKKYSFDALKENRRRILGLAEN